MTNFATSKAAQIFSLAMLLCSSGLHSAPPSRNQDLTPTVITITPQPKTQIEKVTVGAIIERVGNHYCAAATLSKQMMAQLEDSILPIIHIPNLLDTKTLIPLHVTSAGLSLVHPGFPICFKVPQEFAPLLDRGMKAQLTLALKGRPVLSIPTESIQKTLNGSPYVYVVIRSGERWIATRRNIRVHALLGDSAAVQSGLAVHDQVVRNPSSTIRENDQIVKLN